MVKEKLQQKVDETSVVVLLSGKIDLFDISVPSLNPLAVNQHQSSLISQDHHSIFKS